MKSTIPILLFLAILWGTVLLGCTSTLAPLFFPVIVNTPIDLSQEGTKGEMSFQVWRDDLYRMTMTFYTAQVYDDNEIDQYLGWSCTECRSGAPIPLRIQVVKLSLFGEKFVEDLEVTTSGIHSVGTGDLSRVITSLSLMPGRYRITITNLYANRQLKYVPVKIWLSYFRG